MDLTHCIGNYEFSAVPKSIFSHDRESLLIKDKVCKI